MRIYSFPILLMLLQSLSLDILAGIVKSGETVAIKNPVAENLYLAGENINTEAVVRGDLIGTGNVVSIGDTVFDDVAIAANKIQISGDVEGDARLFGSVIKITRNINGDLIIFGGTVHIDKHVVIAGDLRVFCREAVIQGSINGNVHVIGKKIEFNGAAYGTAILKAEKLLINGTIDGPSKLVAKSILLRQNTRFHDDVEYWQKESNLDFSPYVEEEQAIYNEDLKIGFCEFDWHCFGLGILTFALLYALTIVFTISTLVLLFHSNLWKVGVRINESYLKNFGIGALYFIGLPLVTLFLFVIIVGIPLALVFGSIYFLSLLFAFTVSSVILAEGINFRYQKGWGKSKLILMAILIFVGLKVVAAIPFIGLLAVMVLIGMVYGAVIYLLLPKFNLPFLNK